MSIHKVITDIRRLCSLGLGGQLIMPALLQTIHELVPSHTNAFAWADANAELSNCLFEPHVPLDALKLYFNEFYNSREAEVLPTFTRSIQQEQGITDWEQYFGSAGFMRSDLYNLVMRPLGIRHMLRAYVPGWGAGDKGNAGVLILCRDVHERPFTEREKNLVAMILPYIRHAIGATSPQTISFAESDQNGLLIVNRNGEIQGADTTGRYLLLLGCHSQINASSFNDHDHVAVMPLLCNLIEDTIGDTQERLLSPYVPIQNQWGGFTLKAHVLKQQTLSDQMLFGVTIQHHVPMKIKLMQAMKTAPLSAKQKEVCLWLMEGLSQSNIAEQMGISPHSVNDYLKKTYRKLEVHSKDELLKKLLSPMQTA